jgi:hypothetical protein
MDDREELITKIVTLEATNILLIKDYTRFVNDNTEYLAKQQQLMLMYHGASILDKTARWLLSSLLGLSIGLNIYILW